MTVNWPKFDESLLWNNEKSYKAVKWNTVYALPLECIWFIVAFDLMIFA